MIKRHNTRRKFGYTQEVSRAIAIINTNKLYPGEKSLEKVNQMIRDLIFRRHKLGLDHAKKQLLVLRTTKKILQTQN